MWTPNAKKTRENAKKRGGEKGGLPGSATESAARVRARAGIDQKSTSPPVDPKIFWG